MAQAKLVKAANGTGIDGVVGSSDATSITTDVLWVIIASGAAKDVAIANLKDVLYKLENSNLTWPIA